MLALTIIEIGLQMTATAILSPAKFCKKCQCETARYSNGRCKPCTNALNKRYAAANQSKMAESKKLWKDKNKDIVNAYSRAGYRRNIEKKKVYAAAYREKNRALLLLKQAAHREANRDKIRARNAEAYRANPDRQKVASQKWFAKHPDLAVIYQSNRRARVRKAGGKLSKGLSKRLFVLQKGKCPCCGFALGSDYHIDHITPLYLGGSNTDDNVQLLRAECNLKKSAKHPVDFMQERGFLL